MDKGFEVQVTRDYGMGNSFVMKPNGVYVEKRFGEIALHYTGDRAEESQAHFVLPLDPKFLRAFAMKLNNLADEAEG